VKIMPNKQKIARKEKKNKTKRGSSNSNDDQ
jgi:hypothetical protein